jgi:uncharacterized membrane protein YeiH
VPNARRGPCGATKCATLNDVNQLLLLILDLTGTFAFALNGALTAIRLAKLDVVGVLTLGIVTAIGGGILRDVVIGATPPPGFADWRYLAVAGAGALIAFLFGYKMSRLSVPINILDAAGLSLFAVTGASKALALGLGPVPAALLGVTTAVGGGTIRDVMIRRIPVIMRRELYAIPALLAATITVVCWQLGIYGAVSAAVAAAACWLLRTVAVVRGWNAPGPRDGTSKKGVPCGAE